MISKIKNYFLSGILTLIPLLVIYLIAKSFTNLFVDFFPNLHIVFSFLLSFLIIIFLGFFINSFLSIKIKNIFEKISQKNNFFSNVVKLFLNIGEITKNTKKIFNQPILYKVDDGIYELGYISNESFEFLDFEKRKSEAEPEKNSVWIYAPSPLNFMGALKLVESRKIKKIENKNKEEISMFILSAGMIKKEKKDENIIEK